MMKKVIIHNLKTIPKDAAFYWNNNGSGFARQMEIRKSITAFCEQPDIKKVWLSCKRKSTTAAMKEFKLLYCPKNYFSQFMDGDDVFEVFYTEKTAHLAKSVWTLREVLEQSRAALPDALFAVQEGIGRELIVRINAALSSVNSTDSELKALLADARDALPIAWDQHGGCSDDLLSAIDLALQS
jgi:hypothetical protein